MQLNGQNTPISIHVSEKATRTGFHSQNGKKPKKEVDKSRTAQTAISQGLTDSSISWVAARQKDPSNPNQEEGVIC